MVLGFDYDTVDSLASSLASLHGFLDAVKELGQLCIASSSARISNADLATLVSLIEVAKGTMRRSGVRLHLFSSCPGRLQQQKAAYFLLLRDLQRLVRCTRLESPDLIERVSRLLFPLSTPFASGQLEAKDTVSPSCPGAAIAGEMIQPSPVLVSLYDSSKAVNGARTAPLRPPADCENLMPPPPVTSSRLLKRGSMTSGTVIKWNKRRRLVEPQHAYEAQSDGSNDSSESDSDEDAASHHIFIPPRSPLRNSFGIFCTGRGRGGMGIAAPRGGYRTRGMLRPKLSAGNAQRP